MKFSLFLGCVVVSILAVTSGHTFDSTLDEDWKNWKLKYEKQYTEDEEIDRRMVWEDNMRYIEQHNLEHSMGKHTFTVGMNQFGDLTNKEFNELMNGFLQVEVDNSTEEEVDEEDDTEDDEEFEESDEELQGAIVDWRRQDLVTPVKSQRGRCRFRRNKVDTRIKRYRRVRRNERALARAAQRVGPIAIAINAGRKSFQLYNRGGYYDQRCGQRLNHAVLLVGFGTERGKNYWLVKNSWGRTWGKQGYINMAKDRRNNCGIANYAVYPIV
ncbi:testin-2-like [Rhincodon typus]|uniref:testin-2-like n=1 Tax=Rhincodon typus TaxID=259920 RepID=UPI00202E16AC|nr:testin-2-like [Rhincodon typus]